MLSFLNWARIVSIYLIFQKKIANYITAQNKDCIRYRYLYDYISIIIHKRRKGYCGVLCTY